MLSMIRNYRYLLLKKMVTGTKGQSNAEEEQLPPLSIIVPTRDQCDELRQNLPLLLEQDYPQDFEVIVVDINSKDETLQYLESIKSRYLNLRISRMPETVRNVSHIRLALTMGIRAASNEWNVLTLPTCRPASESWLTHMGRTCCKSEKNEIVLGYTKLGDGKGWNGLRCRFFRLWQQMLTLTLVSRRGAYRADGTNVCYQRSLFLSHKGFADHSNLAVGATDIMVNHHSTKQNTAVCLHPDALMLQSLPKNPRWWHQERLFFMETRRHFRHYLPYRLRYVWNVFLTLAFTLSIASVIASELTLFQNYYILGIAIALWLIHFCFRALWFNSAARSVGERPMTFSLPLLLHLVPIWDSSAWFQWLFTNKKMFNKKHI